MSDVPVSILRSALAVSERFGIPRTALLGPGSVREEDLAGRRRRVSWQAFCGFNDRVEAQWRSRGGLERFGRAFGEQAPAELRAIARTLIPPRHFLQLVFALGAWAHPYVTTRSRTLEPQLLELQLTLDPALQDSPSFFRICGATMSGSTVLLGLPPTPYTLTLAPHQATYRFSVPASKTVFARVQGALDPRSSAMLARIEELQAEVRELLASGAQPAPNADWRKDELTRRWRLSRRQTEVLTHLARGESNREIAQALGLAERTVEVHVTELLRRSGLDSRARLVAAFWSEGVSPPRG